MSAVRRRRVSRSSFVITVVVTAGTVGVLALGALAVSLIGAVVGTR
jgi:hypothetical protein